MSSDYGGTWAEEWWLKCELGQALSASFGSLISLLSATVNCHVQSARECATEKWLCLISEYHLLCLHYPRYFMYLLGASIIRTPLLSNSKTPPPPLASTYYSLETVIERKNDDCRIDMRLQSAHWSIYCEGKSFAFTLNRSVNWLEPFSWQIKKRFYFFSPNFLIHSHICLAVKTNLNETLRPLMLETLFHTSWTANTLNT